MSLGPTSDTRRHGSRLLQLAPRRQAGSLRRPCTSFWTSLATAIVHQYNTRYGCCIEARRKAVGSRPAARSSHTGTRAPSVRELDQAGACAPSSKTRGALSTGSTHLDPNLQSSIRRARCNTQGLHIGVQLLHIHCGLHGHAHAYGVTPASEHSYELGAGASVRSVVACRYMYARMRSSYIQRCIHVCIYLIAIHCTVHWRLTGIAYNKKE